MNSDTLAGMEWLLRSLELDASVFHLGQYCDVWKASAAGFGRSAFHLVVHGTCWLHLPEGEPLQLEAGDVVFLLRDIPHALSPRAELDARTRDVLRHGEMSELDARVPGSVGLVCGFFEVRPGLGSLLAKAFPDHLLVRGADPDTRALRDVIQLIIREAEQRGSTGSALIERLTAVLFLYLVRHLAEREQLPLGILGGAGRHDFGALLRALLDDPASEWSLERMARHAGMSRASFVKNFTAASGCSPASFLLALRAQLATQHLARGETVDEVSAKVGYRSTAAFSRAFKRATGQQPGALRRALSPSGRGSLG